MFPAVGRSLCRSLGIASSSTACAATAGVPLLGRGAGRLRMSSGGGGVDVEGEINGINDAFAEAREDIADARDDAETVYFNESAAAARESVQGVLRRWDALLAAVPGGRRGELTRSMGLKMEQLKAELKEIEELHA